MANEVREFVQEIKLKAKIENDKESLAKAKKELGDALSDLMTSGNLGAGSGSLLSKQLKDSYDQAVKLEQEFKKLTIAKKTLEKISGNKYAQEELSKIEARMAEIQKEQDKLAGKQEEVFDQGPSGPASFKDLIAELQDKNIDDLKGKNFAAAFLAKQGADKLFGENGIFKNALSKEKSLIASLKQLKKIFDGFFAPLKKVFDDFIGKLKNTWSDIWKDLETIRGFDSTSSTYNETAQSLFENWGMKDAEAYATSKALEALGFSGSDYGRYLEVNAEKGGALENKFNEFFDTYMKEYEMYQEAGSAYTDLQEEMNAILREFKESVIEFIVDNKETIKAVLEGILSILKGIMSFIQMLFGNMSRNSAKSYDEMYADIATKYSTTNNTTNSGNTLNVNVNNTGAALNPSTIVNPITDYFGSIGVGFKGAAN